MQCICDRNRDRCNCKLGHGDDDDDISWLDVLAVVGFVVSLLAGIGYIVLHMVGLL